MLLRAKLSFFALALLACCHSRAVYERRQDMAQSQWMASARADFDFVIDDAAQPYNIYYMVRNSLDFPFSRIFVEHTLCDAGNATLNKELDFQYLFDPKTGKPNGKHGLGSVFSHRFAILTHYRFRHAGRYRISLEQFNRADTLAGVLSVGVRVERAQQTPS